MVDGDVVIQTTERQLLAKIRTAGLGRSNTSLHHLWQLYLTFKHLTKLGHSVRLVGHYSQARLVIEGGHH